MTRIATPFIAALMTAGIGLSGCGTAGGEVQEAGPPVSDEIVLDDLSERTFRFFWETTDHETGLTPDRHPGRDFSSIAAIGFALTAYPIGAERGWVSREQAAERTRNTLRFLYELPQGPEPEGIGGHKGFFYHFLDMETGHRFPGVELSTVDTALLMAGALFAQTWFDGDSEVEAEIRDLVDRLYARIDWVWARDNAEAVAMGWRPERGYTPYDWVGYNEAMIVYILALGSPTHPLEPDAWDAWTAGYEEQWGEYYGQRHLMFSPHFGHQYSHVWVDFRGIADDYMREKGIDYFENSRRAALAQQAYANDNPMGWEGYGDGVWGLTACDGPGAFELPYAGERRRFRGYAARGNGYPEGREDLGESYDDGTIAPTAAAASIVFTPEASIAAIRELRERYGGHLYREYGFRDAINPSFTFSEVEPERGEVIEGIGWVAEDYLGIDQGPILAMIENHRTGLVWETMKRNPHIRRGLERAGFTGGWLEEDEAP